MFESKEWFWASLSLVLIAILIGWVEHVQSEEKYPTKRIEIICPYTPGGSVDLDTRLVASYMSKKWGVPVTVVNKPGGNTIPGTLEAYKAPADGYTMLGDSSNSAGAMFIGMGGELQNLPFKIFDRTFIASAVFNPMMLFMPFSSPFEQNTLADFVAFAKKNPENTTWCSVGGAAPTDLAIRLLFKEIGVDVSRTKSIIIKGGSEAVSIVGGGHAMLSASTATGIVGAHKGKLVKGVLVTYERRSPLLPDVPTYIELGYKTIKTAAWVGISGPPNLPSHITDKWEKAMEEMMKDPEFISKVEQLGGIPFYLNSRSLREYVERDNKTIMELLKK